MEEIKKIPTRDEIPEADKWAIEDLYPSDEAWERTFATLSQDQEKLASFAGKLGGSGDALWDYLNTSEEVDVKLRRLANYCQRKSDEIGRAHV